MSDDIKPELKSKPEWQASYSGFTIYTNGDVANGWIRLLDENNDVIAIIDNVKSIHLAPRQRT